jgi:hypothetical protein
MKHTEDRRGIYRVFVSELQRKKQLARPGENVNNIKKHLKANGMKWTGLILYGNGKIGGSL